MRPLIWVGVVVAALMVCHRTATAQYDWHLSTTWNTGNTAGATYLVSVAYQNGNSTWTTETNVCSTAFETYFLSDSTPNTVPSAYANGQRFLTYCVDALDSLQPSGYYIPYKDGSSATPPTNANWGRIAYIYNLTAGEGVTAGGSLTDYQKKMQAIGQDAIWLLCGYKVNGVLATWDSSGNLTNGNAIDQAITWKATGLGTTTVASLLSASSGRSDGAYYLKDGKALPYTQNLVGPTNLGNNKGTSTPEASSLLLLLPGLVPLGLALRKRAA